MSEKGLRTTVLDSCSIDQICWWV